MSNSLDALCVFKKGVTLFTLSFLLSWERTSHSFADCSCRRGSRHRMQIKIPGRRRPLASSVASWPTWRPVASLCPCSCNTVASWPTWRHVASLCSCFTSAVAPATGFGGCWQLSSSLCFFCFEEQSQHMALARPVKHALEPLLGAKSPVLII